MLKNLEASIDLCPIHLLGEDASWREDASTSWSSRSSLRGRRRTYLSILELAVQWTSEAGARWPIRIGNFLPLSMRIRRADEQVIKNCCF
jgi:hypothetical protein